MNKLLVLLMVGLASVNCLQLENICSSDQFYYRGERGREVQAELVNAFHKIGGQNITFKALNSYLIDDTVKCNPSEFKNATNFWGALRIKRRYNEMLTKFYNERLNGAAAEEFRSKRMEILNRVMEPLWAMKRVERGANCLEALEEKAHGGHGVFESLDRMARKNRLPQYFLAYFKPSQSDGIARLEKLFKQYKTGGDFKNFALKSLVSYEVYVLALIRPGEFKFLTEGSARPDTKSIFNYDHYLPFYNPKHTDEGCVQIKDLPAFFKNKGVNRSDPN